MKNGGRSPAATAPRSALIASDWSPSRDDADEDHDNRDNEQQVDESTADVHDKEAEHPQDEENYSERPEHWSIPRSAVRCCRSSLDLGQHSYRAGREAAPIGASVVIAE